MIPPPIPSSAGHDAREGRADDAPAEMADAIALAGQAIERRRRDRRWAGLGLRRAGLGGPLVGRGAGARSGHRERDVAEQGGEQERQQPLVEQEGDRAADERADRGEQLQGHPQPHVRDVPLEVDAGRGAAGHDHADERDADRLAQVQPEAEGQQRHDEDAATESQERPERAGTDPAGDHEQADGHVRSGTGGLSRTGRSTRPAQGRRCCGAYGSRAT